MNKKSVYECDEQADAAIRTMVATVVGTAAIPAYVNWSLTATAMGTGVVAIGLIYDVQLTKEEGWKLVRQFFLAAGFWFLTMNVGAKIFAAVAESTGLGYVGGVALDGTISAASAWATGACAKEYFRRDYLGKRKLSKKELGEMFRNAFMKNKK